MHIQTVTKGVREVLSSAEKDNFRVFEIDLSGASNKQTLLLRLKVGLSLPDYFGMNWDALEECLRDIAPTGHNGFLLVFRPADALLALSIRS